MARLMDEEIRREIDGDLRPDVPLVQGVTPWARNLMGGEPAKGIRYVWLEDTLPYAAPRERTLRERVLAFRAREASRWRHVLDALLDRPCGHEEGW